jgi:hypothetical protein
VVEIFVEQASLVTRRFRKRLGLKPRSIYDAYAALKRRSSTNYRALKRFFRELCHAKALRFR